MTTLFEHVCFDEWEWDEKRNVTIFVLNSMSGGKIIYFFGQGRKDILMRGKYKFHFLQL